MTKCKTQKCFYCRSYMRRHEHDHAPFPNRHGGVETVCACLNCHDLKDRTALKDWPLDLTVKAFQALEQAPHPARLLFAKMIAIHLDGFISETDKPTTLETTNEQ